MKYYDTHYEEYIQSVKSHNIHPEIKEVFDNFPKTIKELGNIIVYGPCGSGKYSQVLYLLEKYSPTHLKYDKHVTINTEKQSYMYRISDIHYEIDMGLLGCHSKLLWHELFFQIVDIISMKTEKHGIIVCKNFHMIHSELLEVFYSYIQHSTKLMPNMCLRFVIITEHISFLPNNILHCCEKIAVSKPTKQDYMDILFPDPDLVSDQFTYETPNVVSTGIPQFTYETPNVVSTGIPQFTYETPNVVSMGIPQTHHSRVPGNVPPTNGTESDDNNTDEDEDVTPHELFIKQITETYPVISMEQYNTAKMAINEMSEKNVLNLKELRLLTRTTPENLPKDIFNIICDNIINEITNSHTLVFTTFRENLYDILIYNLDITECVWYILTHFIRIGVITDTTEILSNIYTFLKYYNNNYRPIYHLESILFYLLLEVRKQQDVNVQPNTNDKKTGISSVGNTPASRPTATGKYKSRKNTGTV
jgi:hypothetical protein